MQRHGRLTESWLTPGQFAALLYSLDLGTRITLEPVEGRFADDFVARVGAEYTALHTAAQMQHLHVYRVTGLTYHDAPPVPAAALAPGKAGMLASLEPAWAAMRRADPPVRRLSRGSPGAATGWSMAADGLTRLRTDFARLSEPEARARFRDLALAFDKAMELVGELVPDGEHPAAGPLLRLDALLGTRRFPDGRWPVPVPPALTPAERRVRAVLDLMSGSDTERALRLLGRALRPGDTDGLRGPDAVAARLGGWFGPEGDAGRLTGLPVGAVTPVRAGGDQLLLVHRVSHVRFVLTDPAASGAARFTAFPLSALVEGDAGRLPAPLRGSVRLVTDAAGALRHVEVETRRARAGAPGSAAVTASDRLAAEIVPAGAPLRGTAPAPAVPSPARPVPPGDTPPAATRPDPAPAVAVETVAASGPVPVLVLGEWRAGGGVLDRMREYGGQAGRPVIAVGLAGTPEVVDATLARLDATLRRHARAGVPPLVVASETTAHGRTGLDRTRARWQAVALTQETAGFDRVWRLRDADGTPVTLSAALTADLFRAVAALPRPVSSLPAALAGWLLAGDPAAAAAYHRAHAGALHTPDVTAELDRLLTAAPEDTELAGYRVALDLARRAGGFPGEGAAPLRPAARSILDVEPEYRADARGPVPATFVYDYLGVTGGRRERYPWDGLLFQLMLAGELTDAQVLALANATARTAPDRANITVMEVFMAFRDLPERLLGEDPVTHPELRPLLERIGRVTRGVGGSYADCVDPVDRAAWVGRFDRYRDRLIATGRPAAVRRAALIRVAADHLSNC